MPCYKPILAYVAPGKTDKGKKRIVFNTSEGYIDRSIEFPCGQCIGCRLERSRQWAVRIMHESQLHEDNCFVTLTYRDEDIPYDHGLDKTHFQKFMKRLRRQTRKPIRYYMCGEYGEKYGRPHYHACLFGIDFDDKEIIDKSDNYYLYSSRLLDSIWSLGDCSVGALNFASAGYCARYVMKKQTGDDSHEYYTNVDPITGEMFKIIPPYTNMSLKPAIGKNWYEKYKDEVYMSDEVIVNGKPQQPPKYYDSIYEVEDYHNFKKLKKHRRRKAQRRRYDNTLERLEVKERIKRKQLNMLMRELE